MKDQVIDAQILNIIRTQSCQVGKTPGTVTVSVTGKKLLDLTGGTKSSLVDTFRFNAAMAQLGLKGRYQINSITTIATRPEERLPNRIITLHWVLEAITAGIDTRSDTDNQLLGRCNVVSC